MEAVFHGNRRRRSVDKGPALARNYFSEVASLPQVNVRKGMPPSNCPGKTLKDAIAAVAGTRFQTFRS